MMQKINNITLGHHYEAFIARQIETGYFSSVSEVVRAGLMLLEENGAKLAALRQALKEGEESGFVEYDLKSLIENLDEEDTD